MRGNLFTHYAAHVPLLDATWTLNRCTEDLLIPAPRPLDFEPEVFVEWECVEPHVIVVARVLEHEDGSRWQQTAAWVPRANPRDPLRYPTLETIRYVKDLFVGVGREAYIILGPGRPEDMDVAPWISMFTLLALPGGQVGARRALPNFSDLPRLP